MTFDPTTSISACAPLLANLPRTSGTRWPNLMVQVSVNKAEEPRDANAPIGPVTRDFLMLYTLFRQRFVRRPQS